MGKGLLSDCYLFSFPLAEVNLIASSYFARLTQRSVWEMLHGFLLIGILLTDSVSAGELYMYMELL